MGVANSCMALLDSIGNADTGDMLRHEILTQTRRMAASPPSLSARSVRKRASGRIWKRPSSVGPREIARQRQIEFTQRKGSESCVWGSRRSCCFLPRTCQRRRSCGTPDRSARLISLIV